MPRPISAAFRANSDLVPFLGTLASPLGEPFAACLWASVSKDCRWAPTLDWFLFFCAWARTALNSAVRSCIEPVAMIGSALEAYSSANVWGLRDQNRDRFLLSPLPRGGGLASNLDDIASSRRF